jgi:hypothetical protein
MIRLLKSIGTCYLEKENMDTTKPQISFKLFIHGIVSRVIVTTIR